MLSNKLIKLFFIIALMQLVCYCEFRICNNAYTKFGALYN